MKDLGARWAQAHVVRLLVYVVLVWGGPWLYTILTAADPSEVDPEDDGLPVVELVFLLLCGLSVLLVLVSEVRASRRRDRMS